MPDFSGTVHSYTGCTLDAEIADCLDWKQKPRREDQLRAYIALSRIKVADNLLVVQPYNPWLFRQGQLAGPTLLMDLWRGKLAESDLPKEWAKHSGVKLDWKKVEEMPLRCWSSCQKLR